MVRSILHFLTQSDGRRAIVIGATVAVLAYCVGLALHVQSSPDIGLHATFALKVGRVFPGYLHSSSDVSEAQLVGSTIRAVGATEVENWPHFLRVLKELKARPIVDPADPAFQVRDGATWVRVVLERDADAQVHELWFRLGRPPIEMTLPALLWLILEVGLFGVGAIVYWKRPGVRYAGPFFALSIVAVGAYLGGYHWWQIATQPVLMVVFVACAVLLSAVTLHYFHVFPRSKSWLENRPRLTLSLIYGPPALTGVAVLVGYFWVRSLFRAGAPADVVRDALSWHRIGLFAAFTISAAWFTLGVVALVHSYWRAADSADRNQVKVILVGAVVALGPISYSLYLVIFRPLEFVGGGAAWPMFAASAAITVAFTVSITRYRLLRLDRLIGSGVVYFLITFLAVLVYYGLVFAAMLVVGSQVISGPSLGQAFWVSSTALVMLAVLDLIRSRVNRSLESLYRRDKHQLDRTLHQLSDAIGDLVEPPTLARHLLDASAELLAVSRGAVFLGEGEPPLYRLAGQLGEAPALAELSPGCPLVDSLQHRPLLALGVVRDGAGAQLELLGGEVALGLTHDGRLLGLLILGPKASGFYQAEDYNLLSALAPIASLALQSAAARRAIASLNRDVQLKVEKISEQQERIITLQRQLVRKVSEPQAIEQPADPPPDHSLVGSSAVLGDLLEMVRKVAASPSAVLIRGESGTGKELVAKALHDSSPRAARPFVKVHCAALSPTLLESELFGHVKGAFTGATANKIGRFEMADGGTLFLDEIGDISAEVQIKLLRVLQEKVFERVGSSEPVRVDVRIIAATHQNLERLIQQERFREDLFYRLNVIEIAVPPLRDRREDIPELVQHFLHQLAAQSGRPVPEIEDEAMDALRNFAWPGNIRQLRNIVERTMVVADDDAVGLDDLPDDVRANSLPTTATPPPTKRAIGLPREERKRREMEELVRALADARGNKAEAARALGIPRSTLLSRMQKHGLT